MRFISLINPALLTVFISVFAGIVTVAVLIYLFKLIARQIMLHNSISLVRLKVSKIPVLIALAVVSLMTVYVFVCMIDPQSPETLFYIKIFSMTHGMSVIAHAFTLVMMLSLEAMLITLILSKCAVVDRGVYTFTRYLTWYNVYDYYIDESKGYVILTSDKGGVLSLKGLTSPLKYDKNDTEKLKFILNKNKNKFPTNIK